jgi:tripartite-type tricarboxylate transporter receptor subunit TctC
MGRPFAAPPGTPKARAGALRNAFEKLLTDRAFLAEAKKLRLEIHAPKTGAQVEAMVNKAFDLPQSLKDRVAAAVDPKNAEIRTLKKKK